MKRLVFLGFSLAAALIAQLSPNPPFPPGTRPGPTAPPPASRPTNPPEQVYMPPVEQLPRKVGRQPVPFSHKVHDAQGIKCVDCHPTAKKKLRAGLPRLRDCMNCHQTIATDNEQVQRMATIFRSGVDKVTWVPVYDVPDYVWFSHKKHVGGGVPCADCHGEVQKHDVLAQEVSVNMTSCMNCHAANRVSIECFICHELGQ